MRKNTRPTTIDGIKSLARDLKSEHRIKHADALNLSARFAGFGNFQHAHRALAGGQDHDSQHQDHDQWRNENLAGWELGVRQANPDLISTQTFTGLEAIQKALTPFLGDGVNHALLPTGGGIDIRDIEQSHERGCLSLKPHSRLDYVVKPVRLIMETIPEQPGQSFFLLELDNLAQTGVYRYLVDEEDIASVEHYNERRQEEVVYVDGEYLERSHWDSHSMFDEDGYEIDLPRHSRLTVRWLNGKLLIVAKSSLWNSYPDTYDGRHDQMEAQVIRMIIEDAIRRGLAA